MVVFTTVDPSLPRGARRRGAWQGARHSVRAVVVGWAVGEPIEGEITVGAGLWVVAGAFPRAAGAGKRLARAGGREGHERKDVPSPHSARWLFPCPGLPPHPPRLGGSRCHLLYTPPLFVKGMPLACTLYFIALGWLIGAPAHRIGTPSLFVTTTAAFMWGHVPRVFHPSGVTLTCVTPLKLVFGNATKAPSGESSVLHASGMPGTM